LRCHGLLLAALLGSALLRAHHDLLAHLLRLALLLLLGNAAAVVCRRAFPLHTVRHRLTLLHVAGHRLTLALGFTLCGRLRLQLAHLLGATLLLRLLHRPANLVIGTLLLDPLFPSRVDNPGIEQPSCNPDCGDHSTARLGAPHHGLPDYSKN
jgi:hypothetical protein